MHCDIFVFADHVEYTDGGNLKRNCIKGGNGPITLTVPIINRKKTQAIAEVRIDNSLTWARKMLKSILLAYQRAPYFDVYYDSFSKILLAGHESLSDLNAALITMINDAIGINCAVRCSTELEVRGAKSDMVLSLVKKVGGNMFIAGMGASSRYILRDTFRNEGIEVLDQNFVHPVYPQLHGDFSSKLSAIDCLFNVGGEETRMLLKKSGELSQSSS